jgi:hypothetical protein
MRKALLFLIVVTLTAVLNGQLATNVSNSQINPGHINKFRISVSPTENGALYYRVVLGGPGMNFKPGFAASLEYFFQNGEKLNLGFGLNYQFARVGYTPNMDTPGFYGEIDRLSILSVNFSTAYKLKKNFYLGLKPFLSFQLNYNSELITDRQTGLGLSFSFGKSLQLNDRLWLDLEPGLSIYNVIPLRHGSLTNRLTVIGFNIGLAF